MTPRHLAMIRALASPRLMVAFFALMALAALIAARGDVAPTWAVLPVFLLLGINLGAAIVSHPRFRSDLPLLVFHLALLVFVSQLAWARLTYFEGRVALTVGSQFDGEWSRQQGGPLSHTPGSEIRFANDGFVERFSDKGDHLGTFTRVLWQNAAGRSGISEVSDDQPLVLDELRIYPTRDRGYAPLFKWAPNAGNAEMGAVHLRDQGRGGFTPDGGWQLPNGPEMWAMVEPLDATAARAPRRTRRDLDAASLPHRLVVRVGSTRHEMRPGESIDLPSGRLTYTALRSWLGYRAAYDPAPTWMIASIAVAIASLIAYYARTFRTGKTVNASTETIAFEPRPCD